MISTNTILVRLQSVYDIVYLADSCIAYAIDSVLLLSWEDVQMLPYLTDSYGPRATDMVTMSLRSYAIKPNAENGFQLNAVKEPHQGA